MTRLSGHLLTMTGNFGRSGEKPAAQGGQPFADLLSRKPLRHVSIPMQPSTPRQAAQDSESVREALTANEHFAAAKDGEAEGSGIMPIANPLLGPAPQCLGAEANAANQREITQQMPPPQLSLRKGAGEKNETLQASAAEGHTRTSKPALPQSAGSLDAPQPQRAFPRTDQDLPDIAADAETKASDGSVDDAADPESAAASALRHLSGHTIKGLDFSLLAHAENPAQNALQERPALKLTALPAHAWTTADQTNSAHGPQREAHLSGEAAAPAGAGTPPPRRAAVRPAMEDFPVSQLPLTIVNERAAAARDALPQTRPEEPGADLPTQARPRETGAEPEPASLLRPHHAHPAVSPGTASPARLQVEAGESWLGPQAQTVAVSTLADSGAGRSDPRSGEFTDTAVERQNSSSTQRALPMPEYSLPQTRRAGLHEAPASKSGTGRPAISLRIDLPKRETPNRADLADPPADFPAPVPDHRTGFTGSGGWDRHEAPMPALAADTMLKAAGAENHSLLTAEPAQANPLDQAAQPSIGLRAKTPAALIAVPQLPGRSFQQASARQSAGEPLWAESLRATPRQVAGGEPSGLRMEAVRWTTETIVRPGSEGHAAAPIDAPAPKGRAPAAGGRQNPAAMPAPNDAGPINQRPQHASAASAVAAPDVIVRLQPPQEAGQGFGSLIANAVSQTERQDQALTPVHTQVDRSTGEVKVIRLRLHPEDLGHLTVSLRRRGAHMLITLQAETGLAHARLSAERGDIARGLEAIGVPVAGISVLPMAETAVEGRSGEFAGGALASFSQKESGSSAHGQPNRPVGWTSSPEDGPQPSTADTDGDTYI